MASFMWVRGSQWLEVSLLGMKCFLSLPRKMPSHLRRYRNAQQDLETKSVTLYSSHRSRTETHKVARIKPICNSFLIPLTPVEKLVHHWIGKFDCISSFLSYCFYAYCGLFPKRLYTSISQVNIYVNVSINIAPHCNFYFQFHQKNRIKTCTCKFSLVHCSASSHSGVNFPCSM